ncbi:hypothetical protein [Streptomyces sp. RKAG290]|uniref:hypothetical protein n=1 Tax=Streptomyces sp. RKAG290 TaxID=2888348 RepID=UPI0020349328|nr:hypothetical protein [Streptomyces sp. RKAG290]MCM2411307.1 hypothetical protein [Streptomyces sp. RKAG290]
MIQHRLDPPHPAPHGHRTAAVGPAGSGIRPVGRLQDDGEHQRGPVQAEFLQQGVPGLQRPVEEAAHQGAAALALFRLQRGTLVHVGLGHGAEEGMVRLEQQVDELDQRALLAGFRGLTECLPQDVHAECVGAQQQMQRHPLLGALGGPLAEQPQPARAGVRFAGPAQEEAHPVPGGGGDLQVLHVVGELRVPR